MTENMREQLAREAAAAEEELEAIDAGRAQQVTARRARRQSADPAQVYSVRIPVSELEKLRLLAEQRRVGPSTLMREWVLDRLLQESGGTPKASGDMPTTLEVVPVEALTSLTRMIEHLREQVQEVVRGELLRHLGSEPAQEDLLDPAGPVQLGRRRRRYGTSERSEVDSDRAVTTNG